MAVESADNRRHVTANDSCDGQGAAGSIHESTLGAS